MTSTVCAANWELVNEEWHMVSWLDLVRSEPDFAHHGEKIIPDLLVQFKQFQATEGMSTPLLGLRASAPTDAPFARHKFQ